ncbi:hypothetical protein, partial [uncultured Rhodococcus sp.]|uniref:hypothetical protein n=1 Tax=uncultured Rhodococcus sp. TaxID=194249 RepID=UPI002610BB81
RGGLAGTCVVSGGRYSSDAIRRLLLVTLHIRFLHIPQWESAWAALDGGSAVLTTGRSAPSARVAG